MDEKRADLGLDDYSLTNVKSILNKIKESPDRYSDPAIVRFLFAALEREDSHTVFYDIEDIIYDIIDSRSIVFLREKLQSSYGSVRELAVMMLGYLEAKEAEKDIRKLLDDEEDFVRMEAAKTLGYLKSVQSKIFLIRSLSDSHPLVIGLAAESLGIIGDKSVSGVLHRTLRKLEQGMREPDILWARIKIWTSLYLLGETWRLSLILNALKMHQGIPAANCLALIAHHSNPIVQCKIYRELVRVHDRIPSKLRGVIETMEHAIQDIENLKREKFLGFDKDK